MNPSDSRPLEIHDLTVSYHRKPVLYGIDLEVAEGTLTGIIGPNGAGKSTLIKTIMGMVPSNGGWVKIFGKPAKKSYGRVGHAPKENRSIGTSRCRFSTRVLMGRYAHAGWLKRIGKRTVRLLANVLIK